MATTAPFKRLLDGSNATPAVERRRIKFHKARKPQNGFVSLSKATVADARAPGRAAATGQVAGKHGAGQEEVDEAGLPVAEKGLCPESRIIKDMAWHKVARVGPGLYNLGNTCFLNATLQCLAYLPPLAQYLQFSKQSKQPLSPGAQRDWLSMLRDLIVGLHRSGGDEGRRQPVSPKAIVSNLRALNRHFRVGRQEDAHEFLRHLIDALQNTTLKEARVKPNAPNRRAETTFVHRIFGGYLRSQVRCTSCGYCSNSYEPFLDLSLEIHGKVATLEEAIARFTAIETLDKANRWKCSSCGQLVCAKKQLTIYSAPNVCTVQFKRFMFGSRSSKIGKMVAYPEVLELQVSGLERRAEYKLVGVLVHAGISVNAGHYYSYVRGSNNCWYQMDDQMVQQVSRQTVLGQHAYLLFYLKTSRPPPAGPQPPPATATTSTQPVPAIKPQVHNRAAGASSKVQEPALKTNDAETGVKVERPMKAEEANGAPDARATKKRKLERPPSVKTTAPPPLSTTWGAALAKARDDAAKEEDPIKDLKADDPDTSWRQPEGLAKFMEEYRRRTGTAAPMVKEELKVGEARKLPKVQEPLASPHPNVDNMEEVSGKETSPSGSSESEESSGESGSTSGEKESEDSSVEDMEEKEDEDMDMELLDDGAMDLPRLVQGYHYVGNFYGKKFSAARWGLTFSPWVKDKRELDDALESDEEDAEGRGFGVEKGKKEGLQEDDDSELDSEDDESQESTSEEVEDGQGDEGEDAEAEMFAKAMAEILERERVGAGLEKPKPALHAPMAIRPTMSRETIEEEEEEEEEEDGEDGEESDTEQSQSGEMDRRMPVDSKADDSDEDDEDNDDDEEEEKEEGRHALPATLPANPPLPAPGKASEGKTPEQHRRAQVIHARTQSHTKKPGGGVVREKEVVVRGEEGAVVVVQRKRTVAMDDGTTAFDPKALHALRDQPLGALVGQWDMEGDSDVEAALAARERALENDRRRRAEESSKRKLSEMAKAAIAGKKKKVKVKVAADETQRTTTAVNPFQQKQEQLQAHGGSQRSRGQGHKPEGGNWNKHGFRGRGGGGRGQSRGRGPSRGGRGPGGGRGSRGGRGREGERGRFMGSGRHGGGRFNSSYRR